MSEPLKYEAVQAESIGDALASFRAPNPGYVQDINAAIAESTLLGSALRDIQRLVNTVDIDDHVELDVQLVHRCITVTLKGVWLKIGLLGGGRQDLYDFDYRDTWRDIVAYCRDTGPTALDVQLQDYRMFVAALCKVIDKKDMPYKEYTALRDKIKPFDPLTNGGLRIDTGLFDDDALVTQGRVTGKQPSFERKRGEPLSPLSPPASDDNRFPLSLPFRPPNSPPMSPPTTISSLSQASDHDHPQPEHWARAVFGDVSSSTPLAQFPREDSQYHGPNHPTHEPPNERYHKALEMEFPPKLGAVSLYYAPRRGMRAKMLAQVPMCRGQSYPICLPLDRLEIIREGCMLRLFRPDGRHWSRWVSLNFSNVERLILFASTFTAMRSASNTGPNTSISIRRDGKEDEHEIFSATCENRRTPYLLTLLWDRPSRSIRLSAAVKGGHLEGTPIWTAWITHNIHSTSWCQALGRKTILLRDLRPHVFSNKEELQRAEDGSYCLNFTSSTAAKEFIDAIRKLSKRILERGG